MNETIQILVVEDDIVDRMAVRRALNQANIDVEIAEAQDCKNAVALLKQQEFECVFLDYRLPDGDALQLIQSIRQEGMMVPLVVLTGQGDEQIAVELMKAGASDYLSKGKVSPETLSRSLNNAVRVYRAEQEVRRATQRLQISEERYRLVLEGSNDAIWDWDLVQSQVYGNERLLEIAGLSPSETQVTYRLFQQLIHPQDRMLIGRVIIAHLRKGAELEVEFRLLHRSGEYRRCIARGKAQRDHQGRAIRISGIISDITDRKRAEEKSRFLAEATTLLSSSLDYQTTLQNLARLVVPTLADWCAIDVLDPNLAFRRIAVAHIDSQKEPLIWELSRDYPAEPTDEYGYPKVLRTGESDVCFEVPDSLIQEVARSESHFNVLQQLNLRSYICVPLRTGERILGSILFVWSESPRRYSKVDLSLAEDLAHRAALAIENARLYREAKEASENLRKAVVILGEQQQQLRTLQRLTNLLNQRLTDLPDLLRVMTQEVSEAISGAQICFITLRNPQYDQMRLTVVAGTGAEDLRIDDALLSESGQLRQVLLTGKSKLIEQRNLNPEKEGYTFPASIYAVAIESTQSGRLGILGIGNWEQTKAFDEEDQHLLMAVGEQAAIAIDNARQIKILEEREERLEWQNQVLAEQNIELERHRQQIQLQNLQLMEAARLKSQFLATMSHELRTPMNAIIGFSQLLLRQQSYSLTSKQQEWSERILNNGKTLLALINDILDLSKIEADRLELQLEELDIVQLITTTVENLQSLAEEKSLHLHLHFALEDALVINDPVRLRQVLVNLVSNAIKFTENGSVKVEVQELNPETLEVIVNDTGIGIEETQLGEIFEAFRQGDQTITRKYAGTGLGLAITQSLVHLMDGNIEVESEIGRGSTFRVALPRYVKISPETVHENHISQTSFDASGKRILPKTLKGAKKGRLLY